jgi:hypothetical protein
VAEKFEECQCLSLDYGSYGYPCHLRKNHEGPHEVLDKDDCPHQFGGYGSPTPHEWHEQQKKVR